MRWPDLRPSEYLISHLLRVRITGDQASGKLALDIISLVGNWLSASYVRQNIGVLQIICLILPRSGDRVTLMHSFKTMARLKG